MARENSIEKSKKVFNNFFKNDLYGRFDSDKNIILSRGGWNDDCVSFPKIFKYCTNYTLKKHWTGYSDSLGHRNTIRSLLRLVNLQPISRKYEYENIALTLGNVVTIGFVFRQLKNLLPKSSVITFCPYYSPIIKSINYYFKRILFVSSIKSEEEIIFAIKNILNGKNNKILFLSNSIGVEGRIFSEEFWIRVIKIIQDQKAYLVIDEGMWFDQLKYCQDINNDHVIRIVSSSKKYGLPGCKLGYMLASEKFISQFYDYASTNYGGPLSFFFLLSEFIYHFEFINYSKISPTIGLRPLSVEYGIPIKKLNYFYSDFINTLNKNKKKFEQNIQLLTKWLIANQELIDSAYNFGGINIFIKPKTKLKSYDIFLQSINRVGVSIMPSSCFGDLNDSMFRITLLEKTADLKNGLEKFKRVLK